MWVRITFGGSKGSDTLERSQLVLIWFATERTSANRRGLRGRAVNGNALQRPETARGRGEEGSIVDGSGEGERPKSHARGARDDQIFSLI
jgi:hypothetical protein